MTRFKNTFNLKNLKETAIASIFIGLFLILPVVISTGLAGVLAENLNLDFESTVMLKMGLSISYIVFLYKLFYLKKSPNR